LRALVHALRHHILPPNLRSPVLLPVPLAPRPFLAGRPRLSRRIWTRPLSRTSSSTSTSPRCSSWVSTLLTSRSSRGRESLNVTGEGGRGGGGRPSPNSLRAASQSSTPSHSLHCRGFHTVGQVLMVPSKVSLARSLVISSALWSDAGPLPHPSSSSSLPVLLLHMQVLLAVKGISDTKVEKILEAARKLKPTGFVTGVEGASAAAGHDEGGRGGGRGGRGPGHPAPHPSPARKTPALILSPSHSHFSLFCSPERDQVPPPHHHGVQGARPHPRGRRGDGERH
jgi:hypothetical protein